MKDLAEVRQEIDSIDDELLKLFRRRLAIAADVAAAKKATGMAVCDPARERAILTRVTEGLSAEEENDARIFFSTLFTISKARQRTILNGESTLTDSIRSAMKDAPETFPTKAVVAVPGVEGSYAQQAACEFFPIPTILYFKSFESVFEAVEKGLCPYGVLPIENSAAGSVSSVYDLMVRHRFRIVRALRLKVDHVLLANPGAKLEDIREVASHPHAIAQCQDFLSAHREINVIPGTNTAVAAKELTASGAKDRAVIASRACAELYGLKILAEDIADAAYNYTRFICISKSMEIYPDANKFSIMLRLPHRPGSLNSIISKFSAINVNLTKLESRPIPGMDFEFRFTFEFEAPPTSEPVLALLAELSQDPEIEHFTFLGAYAEHS